MSTRLEPIAESTSPRRLVVFLDIDGVLHSSTVSDALDNLVITHQDKRRVAFVRGELQPSSFGMLVPKNQTLLAEVLKRYPHVVIVISSAWRLWRGYSWVHVEAPDPLWEREHWPAADSDDTALSFSSFFKLQRADVPQRGMTSRGIIEALDVIEHV